MTAPTLVPPRVGPCSPWITSTDVKALPGLSGMSTDLAAQVAVAASDLLYQRTAQQFTGQCGPVTVRPVSRPVDIDTRAFGSMLSPNGYLSAGGGATAYGMAANSAVSHYGSGRPPDVTLGPYPVTAVTKVKIDGVTIPANEYRLQDFRTLVRMRVTAATPPTERWGWPSSQLLDLPDTEHGTFSVTFMYGLAPPPLGLLAVKALSSELAKCLMGQASRLPTRMTSMTRQGITVQVLDKMQYLDDGWTGITEVDYFIQSYNYAKATRPSSVWSPDLGRARRMPS